jgi:hypothetical protein
LKQIYDKGGTKYRKIKNKEIVSTDEIIQEAYCAFSIANIYYRDPIEKHAYLLIVFGFFHFWFTE